MDFRYSVQREQGGKFIVVKYTGLIESSALLPIVTEGAALARKYGITHFLIDLTEARRKASAVGDYQLAYSDLEKGGINKTDLIALLVDPEDHSHDFYETVLANAGYHVRLFLDRELAERYLE